MELTDVSKLKEYLDMCVQMEKSILLQKEHIANLNNEIDSLHPIIAEKIEPTIQTIPKEPSTDFKFRLSWFFDDSISALIGAGVLLIGLLGQIVLWAAPFLESSLDIIGSVGFPWDFILVLPYGIICLPIALLAVIAEFAVKIFPNILTLLFTIGLSILIVSLIVYVIKNTHRNKTAHDSWESDILKIRQYNQEEMERCNKINTANAKQADLYNYRIKAQKFALNTQLKQVSAQLIKTQETLDKLYAFNIINHNYRNINAVSAFWEYLDKERRTTLSGAGGAYELYEQNCKFDQIITSLKNIDTSTSAILGKIDRLNELVQDANRTQKMILQSTRQISEQFAEYCVTSERNSQDMATMFNQLYSTSQQCAYLTEQNQKELKYMNRMNTLAGNYGDNAIYY